MKQFLGTLVTLLLTVSAQAIPLNICFDRDPAGPATSFQLPPQVCVGNAQVFWNFDYPTHDFRMTGTIAGDFALNDFGLTPNDLWLVEATILRQIRSTPRCRVQSSANLNFRFEVSDNTRFIKNPEMRVDLMEADGSCRAVRTQTIRYLPHGLRGRR